MLVQFELENEHDLYQFLFLKILPDTASQFLNILTLAQCQLLYQIQLSYILLEIQGNTIIE